MQSRIRYRTNVTFPHYCLGYNLPTHPSTMQRCIAFRYRSRIATGAPPRMPHLITNEANLARNSTRVWLRQVLEEQGWSAAHWARLAGVDPSTLTRILDPV